MRTRETVEWEAVRAFCRDAGDLNSLYFQIPPTFDLVRCSVCGLLFCNPRLSVDIVNAFYDDYMGGRFQAVIPPYNADFRAEVQRKIADELERELKRGAVGLLGVMRHNLMGLFRNIRALDVGCAHGPMLRCFREKGWRAYGIDVSERAAQRAREYGTVWVGDVHTLLEEQPGSRYDCITLVDVLEHLASPSRVLWNAARVLKPGGVMYLEVPNSESGMDEVSRHFFLFPESCIRAMLERHGLSEYRVVHLSDRYNAYDLPSQGRLHQVFVRKPLRP
ncbi:MAG: class I SAM-dependent methyltransferase [Candidatus Solibacter sp.]|nr:class I SAM-dependent methyltransferase [Candidatus Solibacter sp.]